MVTNFKVCCYTQHLFGIQYLINNYVTFLFLRVQTIRCYATSRLEVISHISCCQYLLIVAFSLVLDLTSFFGLP